MVIELDGYVTIREAAHECHRSAETVRRWVWDGRLPAEKIGNQLFVRRADLSRICKKTAEQIRRDRLEALEKLEQLSKEISRSGETFDILEALERSRESHPEW